MPRRVTVSSAFWWQRLYIPGISFLKHVVGLAGQLFSTFSLCRISGVLQHWLGLRVLCSFVGPLFGGQVYKLRKIFQLSVNCVFYVGYLIST